MGDRSRACRLGMYSSHSGQLSHLPSAGREMSTGQAAVTVLCGREDNRGSGVVLGTCHRQIHLGARRPKEGIDGHLAYTTVKSIASCLPDSIVLLVRMITYSTLYTRQYAFLNTLKKDRERLGSQHYTRSRVKTYSKAARTSTMSISSLSFMLSTVRQPWLMKKYSPGSICTSSFSAQNARNSNKTAGDRNSAPL